MYQIFNETFTVPRASAGMVVGKSGATVKKIRAESGARVQVDSDDGNPNARERNVFIEGNPDQIRRAKQMIMGIVAGANQATSISMTLPADKIGFVIGKGGETIKQICAQSGANIDISRDPQPNPHEKACIIRGTPGQIQTAQHLIRMNLGNNASDQRGYGDPFGLRPYYNRQFTGGAPNVVHPGYSSNGANFGMPAYSSTNGPNAADACRLHIPSDKTGLVIGKGGATINKIRGESGAVIELSDEPINDPTVKTIMLKGWPHQIQCAQQIIQAILGDAPVTTPMPPLQAQTMGGNTFGANPQQFGNKNIWDNTPATAAQSVMLDYSAQWMAYYRTTGQHEQAALLEQQIQQRNQFKLCPTVQQYGDAYSSMRDVSSANNAQPDFSAQWIEYYRAMGMHDQANGLENQMKQKRTQG
ncbi:KH domain-containing protein [Ditylenchus destructor]|nr:KH domain-containing protein [Ditylenchus destructor]